ncbi:hypothetical protein Tco_0382451, partial [Tanacetum coccineum]
MWRELRNRVVTEGSSATVRAHDVRPNRVVRRRLGLWWELRNRVVKEGDASNLLVTSSLGILVASDDGISHGDTTRCADAVYGVPDLIYLGIPPCFTQNQ